MKEYKYEYSIGQQEVIKYLYVIKEILCLNSIDHVLSIYKLYYKKLTLENLRSFVKDYMILTEDKNLMLTWVNKGCKRAINKYSKEV